MRRLPSTIRVAVDFGAHGLMSDGRRGGQSGRGEQGHAHGWRR